jgi:hypothetical protein
MTELFDLTAGNLCETTAGADQIRDRSPRAVSTQLTTETRKWRRETWAVER